SRNANLRSNAFQKFARQELARKRAASRTARRRGKPRLRDLAAAGAGPRPAPNAALRSRLPVCRVRRGARKVRFSSPIFWPFWRGDEFPEGINLLGSHDTPGGLSQTLLKSAAAAARAFYATFWLTSPRPSC